MHLESMDFSQKPATGSQMKMLMITWDRDQEPMTTMATMMVVRIFLTVNTR